MRHTRISLFLKHSWTSSQFADKPKNEDIPFHVNSREGYFEQTEVRLVLWFRAIDNELQDIYLVGLMRSVIYRFKNELAKEN
ncbi:hypothetical protein ACVNPZ_10260 [Staphylococcus aureus]